MIKKLLLVGVVAAIAVVAVKGTGVVKGLRSEYEQAKQAWKGNESPEKQIEKLRGEVSKLDGDVNKVKDELAREIVARFHGEAAARGAPFDLAILDMHMPLMDGLMLAEQLRYIEEHLPLVMLTSIGRRPQEPRTSVLSAFLTKPVKASILAERLTSIFSGGHGALVPEISSPTFNESVAAEFPRKILLAEDHRINQKLAVVTLERLGYRPDVAANGLEVVNALKRQVYDVVLMDVQMPEVSGIAATERIRKMPDGKKLIIIALTADSSVENQRKCFDAGMDDFLMKPFNLAALQNALMKWSQKPRQD